MATKPSNSAAKAPTKPAAAPGKKSKPPERMVSGLLRMGAQTSLRVGASDDPMEREADMVAERVVSNSGAGSAEPPPSRPATRPSWSVMPNTARRASKDTAESGQADPETESRIKSMRGGGRPLSSDERSFFEPRMGHNFSGVRVHEGSSANQAAGALQAKAFTLGSDVFMGSGQYNPGSESGKKLMAHELTHVVQQGGSSGTARRAPADESNVIRRQPRFKNERARQKAIRAAVIWNRRRHTYTDGLALELFKIARTNTPFRRIRRTRRIDSNFVWLVGDTQKKLGLPVTGKLDQRTIRIALQRSGASIGTFAKIMIGIARKIVRNIPNWMFGPVPFLGILFKSAVNRLLDKISRLSASRIGRMIVNTAKAVTSWGFIKAFIKGVYKGFVEDGFIGTLTGIWEIVKLPWTIWQFAKKVFTALNDFRLMESLRGMFKEMSGTVTWIRKNGRAIWNRIGRAARGTRSFSLGGIFKALVKGAQGLGDRIGNSIATVLIKFFGQGAANIASTLGGAAGRFAGNAGWVGLLAAITVGAGAAVAKAVQFVGPILRVMQTGVGRVLRVVRSAWKSLSGFLTKATKGFGQWIHKISPTLSQRFISLFGKMRTFFSRLVGRANRGPLKPKPGAKPKKPGRPKDRDRDKDRDDKNFTIRQAFSMHRHAHTLTVRRRGFKIDVLMASRRNRPLHEKIARFLRMFNSPNDRFRNIIDARIQAANKGQLNDKRRQQIDQQVRKVQSDERSLRARRRANRISKRALRIAMAGIVRDLIKLGQFHALPGFFVELANEYDPSKRTNAQVWKDILKSTKLPGESKGDKKRRMRVARLYLRNEAYPSNPGVARKMLQHRDGQRPRPFRSVKTEDAMHPKAHTTQRHVLKAGSKFLGPKVRGRPTSNRTLDPDFIGTVNDLANRVGPGSTIKGGEAGAWNTLSEANRAVRSVIKAELMPPQKWQTKREDLLKDQAAVNLVAPGTEGIILGQNLSNPTQPPNIPVRFYKVRLIRDRRSQGGWYVNSAWPSSNPNPN